MTGDEVIPLLKVHEYFQGASEEALAEILRASQVREAAPGEVLHEADDIVRQVNFVLRGRLKAVRVDLQGVETLFRMIERGEQFGLMMGALSEPVPIRVIALEPSTVLSLDYEAAFDLTLRHPDLRRAWMATFAGHLRKSMLSVAPRKSPMLVALVHGSPATRRAAGKLLARLSALGEKLAVFSDADTEQLLAEAPENPRIARRPLYVDGRMLELDAIRRQIGEWQDAQRILFDVRWDLEASLVRRLMEAVDRAVIFVEGKDSEELVLRLDALDVQQQGWREKIRVAWLLPGDLPLGPVVPRLRDLICRDFKLVEGASPLPWGKTPAGGLERLVHDLRGVRIGVALGGGAARGMSHLGVLKALEESGIVVDMIAGTSAGAMSGIVYAAGFDADYSAGRFADDLRPSWLFRHIPHGNHWYLLWKYRRGQFDPMLRKYLFDWKLEQLPIPSMAISVDLVSGSSVARDRGDAVHAILESINLPVLSVPICRDGQALIDGGLVNNIPADVLVSQGCNFVIAVSVTARMESRFYGITPELAKITSLPTVVPTLLRSWLVQNHCLTAHGVQPADLVIEPDVTGFDPTEFVRTRELAETGHAAALTQIGRVRQLLGRLDPQLFGKSDLPVREPEPQKNLKCI